MSAADGTVVGTARLVDHGDPARRWNLVILAEGFRNAELPQFRAACEQFINQLYNTPPFTQMWCAINVYCVDIASTDSGADDPAVCGDGSIGVGSTARTFFDTTYCFGGQDRRLLFGNEQLALDTARAAVPEVTARIGIVNHPQYGGAGGPFVAFFSVHPSAAQIGIHELGHSAFRLEDEYFDLNDRWVGGESGAPNATVDSNRATTKWHDIILPATPCPAMSNPNCTTPDLRPSPVPAGTISLFEGAARARCGIYRPEHDCYMRTLGSPFCTVCSRTIRATLAPHMPRLLAPSTGVQFVGTVAGGVTARWFTYNWRACWHVAWTIVPRTPGTVAGPDLAWQVMVERVSREHVTYWIDVTNREPGPVEFEARYEILARD